MARVKHILLTGEKHCGKTTILRRALAEVAGTKIGGFSTKIMRQGENGSEIYIYGAARWFGADSEFARAGEELGKNTATGETLMSAAVRARFEMSEENLVGCCGALGCKANAHLAYTRAFDVRGGGLLAAGRGGDLREDLRGGLATGAGQTPPARVIVMDELGFMERDALAFQGAVLGYLDEMACARGANSNLPAHFAPLVLGVVRDKRAGKVTPFLERLYSHENVDLIEVTRENREEILRLVCERLAAFVR